MSGLRRLGAASLLLLALGGCSEEPAGEVGSGPAGKTPVVRPEDVHGPGGGRAAVLAPDYRQGMNPGVTDPPAAAVSAKAAGEPEAGRLFAAKPGVAPVPGGQGAGGSAAPAAPSVPQVSSSTLVAASPSGAAALAVQSAAPAVVGTAAPSAAGTTGQAPPVAPGLATGAAVAAMSGGNGRNSDGFPVGEARQLVLVTAADTHSDKGVLRRLVRSGPGAPWSEAGPPVICRLGRKGLGQGRGLAVVMPAGPDKGEGDGRTPAGLFPLPSAFGYAPAEAAAAAGVRLPYVAVTDRTSCVTDPGSPLFGQVVGPKERPEGGLRQDRMVRDDGANAWGVVIGHNAAAEARAGTCLFVNVRPAGGPATGGSIGIPAEAAAALAAWLDPAAAPLLAVLPEAQARALGATWGLP
jgi:L,D-peptidoglycan transpeptidase YkuD (ErfK/YbiS/YcfS/YnhG family)